ncbi:hypothetical protein D1816_10955 [Aquimarina sp. AD10]|uniref:Acyl carrier protein n=1 Tax=Aquimarina aggregata TaxID=1642818 RepID=A0A162FBT2_9FLAO|nr:MULTISPECIES: hypothetical protein [Aquimarina]AXT60841.1 hypothetical protein D1816_10955 [Aquimarina sp. AD10]KZS40886.1 hypothetical protein AWE51_24750 [Aquimarina aggregata]RKM98460.1 hypothetical protein D7033_12340 [Aquimarina sp. AD10]
MNTLEKERIVQKNVLQIFKENFGVTKTEEEILDIKPENEFELNSTGYYYESILDIFLIEDMHKEYITGKVKDTIKKVAELWTITMQYSLP